MKEMNWTREEALKRLAFVYQETNDAMNHLACKAATAPMKRIQDEMFADACEKSNVMVGILMAADAIGISMDEITELKVDEVERRAFVKGLADKKREALRKDLDLDTSMRLGDLLSDLLG